jgi:hypothetical protein
MVGVAWFSGNISMYQDMLIFGLHRLRAAVRLYLCATEAQRKGMPGRLHTQAPWHLE